MLRISIHILNGQSIVNAFAILKLFINPEITCK